MKVFLDDVLVFSQNANEHCEHVQEVINRLQNSGAAINMEKSTFMKESVNYLGMIINKDGIRADVSRVDEYFDLGPQNTKKKLQKLIGFINWFRDFIPNLSTKIIKLTDKLIGAQNAKKIDWKEEDEIIKTDILKEIKEQILLEYPDFNQEFILTTDASEIGAGAILRQGNRIIGLTSKKFNKVELNYTSAEKELYAVILALKKFRNIILMSTVKIQTDNKNIIAEKELTSSRLQRWKILLQEYNYELSHIEGQKNTAADHLSRCYAVQKMKEPASENGENYIYEKHKSLLHPGIQTLYYTIRKEADHPNLKKTIIRITKNCHICNLNKPKRIRQGIVVGRLSTQDLNKGISTDIFGPFSGNDFRCSGQYYIISITDLFSRYTLLSLKKQVTSNEILESYREWINQIGCPEVILSDNGRQYIAKTVKEFCIEKGIKQKFATPYNPTGNGISERLNQSITKGLRVSRGKKLGEVVREIQDAINSCYHFGIGAIPSEAMKIIKGKDEEAEALRNAINEKIKKENAKNLYKINNGRAKVEPKVDEVVYVQRTIRTNKLEPAMHGPYVIKEIGPEGQNMKVVSKEKEIMVNIKQIKFLGEGVDVMDY